MRYPNLRYGSPDEMRFHAQGLTVKKLAKRLRRSERSVNEWLSGSRKVPWWIPEILRLQHIAHCEMMHQMRMTPVRKQLGIVSGSVLTFPTPKAKQKKINACEEADYESAVR
jgi:transcriptional regulator with XRE-family HTH domain